MLQRSLSSQERLRPLRSSHTHVLAQVRRSARCQVPPRVRMSHYPAPPGCGSGSLGSLAGLAGAGLACKGPEPLCRHPNFVCVPKSSGCWRNMPFIVEDVFATWVVASSDYEADATGFHKKRSTRGTYVNLWGNNHYASHRR